MGEVIGKDDHDEQIGELETKVTRMEEHYATFELDADRLQEMIVENRIDDALHTLRNMLPDHPFLAPATQRMLADIRQDNLFPAEGRKPDRASGHMARPAGAPRECAEQA